jgi:hypothetical protein
VRKGTIIAIVFAFLYGAWVSAEEMPCEIPPFLAEGLEPNVLIVFDTSGSMTYNVDDKASHYYLFGDGDRGHPLGTYELLSR